MTIYHLESINSNYDLEEVIYRFYTDRIDIVKIDSSFYHKRHANLVSALNAAIKRHNLECYMYAFSTHRRVYLIRDDLFDNRQL